MNSITINFDDTADMTVIYNQLKKQYPKFEIVKNHEITEDLEALFPSVISTKDFKFNREEANER